MEYTVRRQQDDFHAALLRGDAGVLDSVVLAAMQYTPLPGA
jgi:hypothetical protein